MSSPSSPIIISSTSSHDTRKKRTRASSSSSVSIKRPRTGIATLPNPDSRCFMNVVIQLLASLPLFVSWVKEHVTGCALASILEQLEKNQVVSEEDSTALLNWLGFELAVHHDVLECILTIFKKFENYASWIDFKAACVTSTTTHLISTGTTFKNGQPWSHSIHENITYVIPMAASGTVTTGLTNLLTPAGDTVSFTHVDDETFMRTSIEATVSRCDVTLPAILIVSLKRKVYNQDAHKFRKCMAKVPSEDEMVLCDVSFTLVGVIAHIGFGVQSGTHKHTQTQNTTGCSFLFFFCVRTLYLFSSSRGRIY